MPSSKYGLLPMGIQPSPLYSIKTNLTPTVHLGDSILRFSTTIGMQCVPRAEQCAGIHEPVVVVLRFSVLKVYHGFEERAGTTESVCYPAIALIDYRDFELPSLASNADCTPCVKSFVATLSN